MNKAIRHTVVLLLLLWNSVIIAQQYLHYNEKNGLPSNHIYRITQDNEGFMWFLTDKGMVKFNGTTFKTFTTKEGLPTNDIWDIRITPNNKIWYFTKAEKLGYISKDSVYAFKNSKNKILYPIVINQNKENVFFTRVNTLYFLKNIIWESKQFDKTNFDVIEVLSHPIIKKLEFINKDSMAIVDKNNVIKKRYAFKYKLPSLKHRAQINDSLFVWIYTDEIKFLNLNNLKLYTEPLKTKTNLTRFNTANQKIQFSGENFVAFLDKNYHLVNYRFIPKKFHSHYSFVDKNNNIWIATFNNGVFLLPNSKQNANYLLQNEKVGAITKVNQKIITNVYNKGFYLFDTIKQQFKTYLPIKDFLYSAKYIKELKTEYYLSDTKSFQIKNQQIKTYNSKQIARKLAYFNSKLYTFNAVGLNLLNTDKFTIKKQWNQSGIRDILPFKQHLILATSNGLKYFDKDSIKTIPELKKFKKPTVTLTKLNKNELIIATDGFGAYTTNLKKITLLEKSDYLDISNAKVHNNKIYLATNKGVWEYYKKNNTYHLNTTYTINNGLNSNNINDVYFYKNQLITSSNSGISIIPLHQKKYSSFLSIYFDKVYYGNKSIQKNTSFPYQKNSDLQVKTGFIDYSTDSNKEYTYRLLPIQNKWISTNSQHISFNDLPPNDYVLQVKSHHLIKKFPFTIQPLWYQTYWFKIISVVGVLGFLIGIVLIFYKKEQTKQEKKLQAQKKLAEYELHALRSQMNPHFVFNSLNAIQYYITKNNIELSEKYLVKFARLIRMFFDFSREKEIPLFDEIKLLKGYLEIEKMRFGKDFNFNIKVINPKYQDQFTIPTMLLQPIVENAVNHGLFHNKGKGQIDITFNLKSKNEIEVIISDNGIGIKKSKEIQQKSIYQQKKNNSTQVIKERIALLNHAKKWKVTYKLIEKEIGTTVQLTFIKNEKN